MADILIRGMEMPPTGNYFMMVENEPGIEPNVTVWKRQQNGELKHFSFCPLVELPEHGDLIDRDALPQDRVEWEDVVNAPVVIPANKEAGE